LQERWDRRVGEQRKLPTRTRPLKTNTTTEERFLVS
jgi:hypothetical protein